MNTEPRQKTISIPSTLDKRFREYCTRHNLGRIDAVARLLDVAESRDTTQEILQEILRKLDGVQESIVPTCAPQPVFSCGGMVLELDDVRWFIKGKYTGWMILDVVAEDPGYIDWLLNDAQKYDPKSRFALTAEEQEAFEMRKV